MSAGWERAGLGMHSGFLTYREPDYLFFFLNLLLVEKKKSPPCRPGIHAVSMCIL